MGSGRLLRPHAQHHACRPCRAGGVGRPRLWALTTAATRPTARARRGRAPASVEIHQARPEDIDVVMGLSDTLFIAPQPVADVLAVLRRAQGGGPRPDEGMLETRRTRTSSRTRTASRPVCRRSCGPASHPRDRLRRRTSTFRRRRGAKGQGRRRRDGAAAHSIGLGAGTRLHAVHAAFRQWQPQRRAVLAGPRLRARSSTRWSVTWTSAWRGRTAGRARSSAAAVSDARLTGPTGR